jgi:hypothetical protein
VPDEGPGEVTLFAPASLPPPEPGAEEMVCAVVIKTTVTMRARRKAVLIIKGVGDVMLLDTRRSWALIALAPSPFRLSITVYVV